VAKTQTTSEQLGLSRNKAVLIGVLAVVLVGVLVAQYRRFNNDSGGDLETAYSPPRPRAPRTANAATKKPDGAATHSTGVMQAVMQEFDQTKWQPPELSVVLAYDPFALPAKFPKPPKIAGAMGDDADSQALTAAEQSKQIADALEEARNQLEELKQRGVHVVLGRDGQWVAVIGDRQIRIGDEINEFKVTGIDPKDGVLIEWKDAE
jgi:hypothetical protein